MFLRCFRKLRLLPFRNHIHEPAWRSLATLEYPQIPQSDDFLSIFFVTHPEIFLILACRIHRKLSKFSSSSSRLHHRSLISMLHRDRSSTTALLQELFPRSLNTELLTSTSTSGLRTFFDLYFRPFENAMIFSLQSSHNH